MAWILVILVGALSQPVTVTYPTLHDCNTARDFTKGYAQSTFCIPAPEKR